MPVIGQVQRVTIEFRDGTVKIVDLPEDAGYLKEDYTYEVKEPDKSTQGLNKWGRQLRTHTLYWAEVVESEQL